MNESKWKEFIKSIPRLLIAILIAVIISKPLEIKLFDSEIQAFLEKEKISQLYGVTKKYSSDIDGVIAFHPGRSGKFAKEKKPHKGWINWRNYKISLINVEQLENVLVYSHDKDDHENPKTLKFLSNSNFVKFLNVSDTSCKKKIKTGGWHGITLTKCFADEDPRSKEIIKYLKQIY